MTDRHFESRITLIQQGDRQGLKDIYSEYGKMIYQCCYNILRSPQDAEDVTADFFLKLWKIADTYCFGGKHKRWLVTIARNMALDLLKKQSREQLAADDIDYGEDSPDTAVSTEDTVTGGMAVAEALGHLEQTEREIVSMRVLADMTFKDIAAVLGKPMGTVTWKYRNAILKLKKFVGEVGDI